MRERDLTAFDVEASQINLRPPSSERESFDKPRYALLSASRATYDDVRSIERGLI